MQRVHFIAIGGSAMHSLAIALSKKRGYEVSGSDEMISEPAYSRLSQNQLLPMGLGWFPEKITRQLSAVIVGMRITPDNPELLRAYELGLPVHSVPEYLFIQTRSKTRIVVGGSHGKTTTTAMILHVMRKVNFKVDYMIGAQLQGYENRVGLNYDTRVAVFEGDEYSSSVIDARSKFHHYKAHIAVLTGVAWDHVNVFPTAESYAETFNKFIDTMETQGRLIYFEEDESLKNIVQKSSRIDIVSFPYNTPEYEIRDGINYVKVKNEWVPLQVFGEHNLQNIEAARIACRQVGIWDDKFYKAIADFTGVTNRLEKIVERSDRVAYRDVADTPAKLKATIRAVRDLYPGRRIIACMELQSYSGLAKKFLSQYESSMMDADLAFVCYSPSKRNMNYAKRVTKEAIQEAFGGDNLTVFDESTAFKHQMKELNYDNSVLLLMTSSDFLGNELTAMGRALILNETE